eukprot:16437126-Heterocapsa_arctica.AAC.1
MLAASRAYMDEANLRFTEPLTKQARPVDHVRFADDLATIGIVKTASNIRWRLRDWDHCFHDEYNPDGLDQNLGNGNSSFT